LHKAVKFRNVKLPSFITGSKYLQPFSSAVLKLQEDGILDNLKRKWWKEERKEATCDVILILTNKMPGYEFGSIV